MRRPSSAQTIGLSRGSSPAMALSNVVLPTPDGPSRQMRSPSATVVATRPMTGWPTTTPSRHNSSMGRTCFAPGGCSPVQRLQQYQLDQLHHRNKGQAVGQNARHIEHLKGHMQLKADAIGASEQLHHQNDLPDQRQPASGRRHKVRKELRQPDMNKPLVM